MVPGSLDNNRIFKRRHAGGKENHREILAGGAKGIGRRDGCSMASRFAKDRSNGGRGCLYRQFVKRSGKLSSRGRDLSRNAGSSATSAPRGFSLRPRAPMQSERRSGFSSISITRFSSARRACRARVNYIAVIVAGDKRELLFKRRNAFIS